jgi:hypothetical protein
VQAQTKCHLNGMSQRVSTPGIEVGRTTSAKAVFSCFFGFTQKVYAQASQAALELTLFFLVAGAFGDC